MMMLVSQTQRQAAGKVPSVVAAASSSLLLAGTRDVAPRPDRVLRAHRAGPLLAMVGRRGVTDIKYYEELDKSHLHVWDYRSTRRQFLLKLERAERAREVWALKMSGPGDGSQPRSPEAPLEIPDHVERGPADILWALAGVSTSSGRDPTAPDYKFHDDPYLIPYNSLSKRDYLVSKDGGRRAAAFVLENHPELFANNLIDRQPNIAPKASKALLNLNKGSSSGEEALEALAGHVRVTFHVPGALRAYKVLQDRGLNPPADLMQDFLELLCFHNGEEEKDELHHNELAGTFVPPSSGQPTKGGTGKWQPDGPVETVFADIVGSCEPGSETARKARLALLCAACKFGAAKRARKLEGELAKEDLNLEAFNGLIKVLVHKVNNSSTSKDDGGGGGGSSFEQGIQALHDLLKEMADLRVRPDVETLFNCLSFIMALQATARSPGALKAPEQAALALLAEFKHNLGILPSLGCYSRLMAIFSAGKRPPASSILLDILDELEARGAGRVRPEIEEDFEFFSAAMESCLLLNNLGLAYRLHRLAMRIQDQDSGIVVEGDDHPTAGPGLAVLGDFQRCNQYYQRFMMLVTRREPPDVAMELYGKLVPHVWTPTLAFYGGLLKELAAAPASQGSWRHLPKLWADLQANNFCSVNILGRMEFVSGFAKHLLRAVSTAVSPSSSAAPDAEEVSILTEAFVRIANDMFRDVDTSKHSKRHPLSVNVHAMGICQSLLELAVSAAPTEVADEPSLSSAVLDLALARSVVRFCRENVTVLTGSLSGEAMARFLDIVVARGDKGAAFDSVVYAAENNMPEALEMGHRFVGAFGDELDKVECNQLNLLFSHETKWVTL